MDQIKRPQCYSKNLILFFWKNRPTRASSNSKHRKPLQKDGHILYGRSREVCQINPLWTIFVLPQNPFSWRFPHLKVLWRHSQLYKGTYLHLEEKCTFWIWRVPWELFSLILTQFQKCSLAAGRSGTSQKVATVTHTWSPVGVKVII